ncbi:exopolyphosphatase [Blumeria hordei DH14]|uniref:Exopolyphosphatase n=1 Tax=Blumeria graminis f. sp. hordei (strain DH14) TaxID=546991 RepID=N1J9Q4_BLUG1|nr:exopolyphosphatase [Blumeria hordei DH14]
MNSPRASLPSFLSAAKHALTSYNVSQLQSLTFVIGNESADLDSICSAVVWAYMLTYFTRSKAASHRPTTLYVPLTNIPRADFGLRPELNVALHYAQLTPGQLISLNDLPVPLPPPKQTRWLLVDHNSFTGSLGELYGSRVLGCIDHHDDEGRVPRGTRDGEGLEAEPRIIQPSGSCASLVIAWALERWKAELTAQPQTNWSTMNENEKQAWQKERQTIAAWDAQLARLALAPILIDSACLTSSKTTSMDTNATNFLEWLIKYHEGTAYDRAAFYKELSIAKEDISSLSFLDALRKDYKQWNEAEEVRNPNQPSCNLGIVAVVQPLSNLISKAGNTTAFLSILHSFSKERHLSILAIMTTSHPEQQLQRELLVWGMDARGAMAVQWFETQTALMLGLENWEENSGRDVIASTSLNEGLPGENSLRRVWNQRMIDNSRKQVAPLLRAAIRMNKGPPNI